MKFTDNAVIFRENVQEMEETEVLCYLLRFTQPEHKVDSLAASLIDNFGSLKSVLEARPEQLRKVPGIGLKTANLLSAFIPVVRTWQKINMTAPERIGNTREAESYCKSILTGARTEEFYVICLSARCSVLGKRRIATGSISEVSAYPRLVIETALNYNAHSVILSHNHPGGTCAPSPEDISSTMTLQKLLNGIGIIVLDHIIIAGEKSYSMIQHGDINHHIRL